MRHALVASLLLAAVAPARAQNAINEYRPELVLTLPRIRGYGVQLLVEDHLETSDLYPNERIQGVGLISPTFYSPINARFVIEARQVKTPTVTEHRYIPTVLTTIGLFDGFEMRSRTRAEVRDINQDWSVRWQDRSAVGHEVELAGLSFWAYGQIDLSYDSRFSTLNRIDKTGGARFDIVSGTSIDLFIDRQDDTRRTPRVLYAYGAILRVAL